MVLGSENENLVLKKNTQDARMVGKLACLAIDSLSVLGKFRDGGARSYHECKARTANRKLATACHHHLAIVEQTVLAIHSY